jgi:hypothetical protein
VFCRISLSLLVTAAAVIAGDFVPKPCSESRPLTYSPIALSEIVNIRGIGNLNPPSHTFPSTHAYFYVPVVQGEPGSGPFGGSSIPVRVPIYSPGDLTITQITKVTVTLETGESYIEHDMELLVCDGVAIRFAHIGAVSEPIMQAIQEAVEPSCGEYEVGGRRYRQCRYSVAVPVTAGEPIAAFSGRVFAFDIGAVDYNAAPLGFVSMQNSDEGRFNLCPFALFEPNIRVELEKRIDRAWWAPACGRADYDIARTAQGNWFANLDGNLPGDHNLALVYDPRNPNTPVFSAGSRIPGLPAGMYGFVPRTNGKINRRFHEVTTADQSLYCYEGLRSLRENRTLDRITLLLSVSEGEILNIEAREAESCGTGPWEFTDRLLSFVR